ncbi:MAG: hypothetical protein J6P02_02005 [Lachnospiraceae bacterium]|nr:hypothetical protein [Lachnospiraceae bacterium]
MKRKQKRFIVITCLFLASIINTLYASEIIDKKGRIVEEIIKPTAEKVIDENTISDAIRRVPNLSADYNGDTSNKYAGPSKNIFSEHTLYSEKENANDREWTLIRHTPSITDLSEEKYILNEDDANDRIRIMLITPNGMIEGKDGFFKIEDKIYYFDEKGLMVLGPCYDTIGNYYFFSYDTGELIEEVKVR